MRALITLTVSESKALIAKAVVKHPVFIKAFSEHIVVLGSGTTNAYVLAEITGERPNPGAFVAGIICPEGACVSGVPRKPGVSGAKIFVKGVEKSDIDVQDILKEMGPDDLIVKGANAIDPDGRVGIIVGHAGLGHGGLGELYARSITQGIPILVPVGLEKRIPGSVFEAASKLGVKTISYSTGTHYGLFVPHGNVSTLTEIDAIRQLTGAEATVVAAGGVNGAEGALVFSVNGSDEQVQKVIELLDKVKGQPPIVVPRGVCIATKGYTACYASQCIWKRVPNSKRPVWKRRQELNVHEEKTE